MMDYEHELDAAKYLAVNLRHGKAMKMQVWKKICGMTDDDLKKLEQVIENWGQGGMMPVPQFQDPVFKSPTYPEFIPDAHVTRVGPTTCECGATKANNTPPFHSGHSDWCPVSAKKEGK